MKLYKCPVCGYGELSAPPINHLICPSCGTEFEYDDFMVSHEELRKEWLAKGAPWFSRVTPRPIHWNGYQQLINAGYIQPELISSVSESKPRNAVVIGSPLVIEVDRRNIRFTFGALGIKQSIPTTLAPQLIAKMVRP